MKKSDCRPIGVFDSGLGGLTVVSAIRKAMPNEDIIYLGDSARVPYGNKSVENIKSFAVQICNFLATREVKAIVVACNTVSAVALEEIKTRFKELPVIDVLTAGVRACVDAKPEYVAVLGTRATVLSDAYRREIQRQNPEIAVKSIACPLFVPLVEEGLGDHELASGIVGHYLGELKSNPPDILLLGCTHYPLLKNYLSSYFKASVKIIDSAAACALYTETFIKEKGMTAAGCKTGEERFYVTDMPGDFYVQASRFLGYRVGNVEKVNL